MPYIKHRKITGKERGVLRMRLSSDYRRGATIRELAIQTGRSYASVRTLLIEAGVTLRPRGGVSHASALRVRSTR